MKNYTCHSELDSESIFKEILQIAKVKYPLLDPSR